MNCLLDLFFWTYRDNHNNDRLGLLVHVTFQTAMSVVRKKLAAIVTYLVVREIKR